MSARLLSGEEWREVLRRLAQELRASKLDAKVTVIGGVAMALAYNSRRTTNDMYVVLPDEYAGAVIAAADRVAPEFGLDPGWLNQRAKESGLVPAWNETDGSVVFHEDGLVVVATGPLHLLAMKLWAGPRSETDVHDIETLVSRLRTSFSDPEVLWSIVGSMLPVDKRQQAHHNLVDIWNGIP